MGIRENIIDLFFGKCNIYEMTEKTDGRGVTAMEAELKHRDIDCRLVFGSREGFGSYKAAAENRHKNNAFLNVRVFLPTDIYVKPGSLMEVAQNGVTYKLRSSSEGSVYKYHQEIIALPDWSEA